MIFKEEISIKGSGKRPITFDVNYNPEMRNMPIALFCHGFKGFKDWGAWNLVAEKMAEAGIFFIKMNFSHNGVSVKNLNDISDAEAFAENTFSLELDDLGLVLDWICKDNEEYKYYFNPENISVIGHSRGAPICLLKSIEDDRIGKVITWAGAFNLGKFVEMEDDAAWQERGFVEVKNARTGDVYPINYSFRKDYLDHAERLNLAKRIADFDQELMLIHGKDDETAPISNSRKIHEFVKHSVYLETNGNHTFGSSHPWTSENLPTDLLKVMDETSEFVLLE
ncbi:MAG: alpha/beta hydrolase [Flavobacteriales bacterium]|nr:alpha/beta hydrolase [Flavobacteriales bacterium]